MFRGTTKEFSEHMGIDYPVAAGLVKFLVLQKIATDVGPQATGKRPARVYEIPSNVSFTIPAQTAQTVEQKLAA